MSVRWRSFMNGALVLSLLVGAGVGSLEAQIGSITKKVKKAVDKEVDEAERDIDKAIDDAIACVVGDERCVKDAKAEGKPVVLVDEQGNPVAQADTTEAEKPGEGRWTNYDYLRGERPIYQTRWNIEDTENPPAMKPNPTIRVGRIPPNIEFGRGNMQITQVDGENVLEFSANSWFRIHLDQPLPEDFSLEFTLQTAAPNAFIYLYFEPFTGEGINNNTYEHHYLSMWRGAGIYQQGQQISGATSLGDIAIEPTTFKFQVDDGYAIMYVGAERIAQVPNFSAAAGSRTLEFIVNANDARHAFIRDIRVDYGVDDPYETFIVTKEYTTRSIYFAFNSDALRPESTPELERLRMMLANHPELEKITIEGHTDALGSDEYNLELSARRAAAVKLYLVNNGIEPGRIATVGKGEREPVAANDTDEGRHLNRRVKITMPDM